MATITHGEVSRCHNTLGVTTETGGETCHVNYRHKTGKMWRICIDGIWTVLCTECRTNLRDMLAQTLED